MPIDIPKPVLESRPSSEETRQKILDAAAQVFSERGYTGAATRVIAARAGVNEVTLFRHFSTKINLFQAMIQRNSALPDLKSSLRSSLSGDIQKDLSILVTHILNLMLARRQEILMSLAEAERLPEMREMIAFIPAQQRKLISDYLKQQIDNGQVRDIDPELSAQALLGTLLAYSISLGLLPDGMVQKTPEEVANFFVDLFVEGIRK